MTMFCSITGVSSTLKKDDDFIHQVIHSPFKLLHLELFREIVQIKKIARSHTASSYSISSDNSNDSSSSSSSSRGGGSGFGGGGGSSSSKYEVI